MTKVAILPTPTGHGGFSYRGIAGDMRSEGKTPGEALDALTSQMPKDEDGTGSGLLVIVQGLQPDRFFGAVQQRRMAELMREWQAARDRGQSPPLDVQAELDTLAEAELYASAGRAAALADELHS